MCVTDKMAVSSFSEPFQHPPPLLQTPTLCFFFIGRQGHSCFCQCGLQKIYLMQNDNHVNLTHFSEPDMFVLSAENTICKAGQMLN